MIERERPSESAPPAHERVYRSLRARIMHGQIAPGIALTLRGIAAEYGVSMTPAREAVRRLVAEGALKLSRLGAGVDAGARQRADRGAGRAPGADRAGAGVAGRCRGPMRR